MKTYYLISTSSRSANSIRDHSDEITTYSLSTFDPNNDDQFDRYVDTTDMCLSPGHLDSSTCPGDGEGNIYSYVLIKKQ